MSGRLKKIIRKTAKIVLWVFLVFIFLLIVAVVTLQFPATQNYITRKAIHFISDKTHTRVELGEINVAFPKSILLKDLFLEDQQHDTLIYAHRLAIDISMWQLLHHKIDLNNIKVEQLTAHVSRSLPDSSFNFDFILDALAPADTTGSLPDTSVKSLWKFSLGSIALKNIFFTYQDETTGSDMVFRIGNFDTRFKTFDADKMKYHLGDLNLDHSMISITQSTISTISDTNVVIPYDVAFNAIHLDDVNFRFQTPQQKISAQSGKVTIDADNINLQSQRIDLKKVLLDSSSVDFAINKYITADTVANEAKEAITKQSNEPRPWMVTIKNLSLVNNTAAFNNFNSPELKEGTDFNHLLLTGIQIDAKDVNYNGTNISADIRELKTKDQSGFEIKHFQTKLTFDSIHAELADLDLQTSGSHIKKFISVRYPSIEKIVDSLSSVKISADFDHAVISLNDLYLLQPSLLDQLQINHPRNQVMNVTAKIDGRIGDLNISQLDFRVAAHTTLIAKGRIKGLPDIPSSWFDVDVKRFTTSNTDVQSLLKPDLLPANIAVPEALTVSGFFKGTLKNFDGKADIHSSFGDAIASVHMENSERFNVLLTAQEFDLGQLLRNPEMLGPVTLDAKVDGTGLTPETVKGTADVTIAQAVVKKYNYKDIVVKGNFSGQHFDGLASIHDPNVVMSFNGFLSFDQENPYVKATVNVEGADLQALHLTQEDWRVKVLMTADIKGSDINNLNGNIDLRNVVITKNDTVYPIDSFLFVSISETDSKSIDIKSPFMMGSFKGNIGVGDLATAMNEHLNRYFKFSDTLIKKSLKPQDFTFNVEVFHSDIYRLFVPALKEFEPAKITGSFNSEAQKLDINATLPKILYDNIQADSLQLNIQSDAQALRYNISLESVSQNGNKILKPSISGSVADNKAGINFTARDREEKTKYLVSGNLQKENSNYRISLLPDSLILDYKKWSASPDNYLVFGDKTFYANNIQLTSGNQSLKISSASNEAGAPLEMTFTDFNLEDLSHIIESSDTMVGGIMNGTVVLKNLQSNPAFVADLSINDFSFREDTVGNIKITSDNESADRYNAKVIVKGQGNDISLSGFYNAAGESPSLDFDVNFASVNLHTLEAFSFGHINRMYGTMTGNLKITGNTSHPNVNGVLKFKDARLSPAILNTSYKLENEQVTITDSKVLFSNFTISDSLGAKAIVNGYVLPDENYLMAFDLSINTKNFLALNASKNDTAQFYGKVILDSYARITGNSDFPNIEADLKLKDGSSLTIKKSAEEIKAIESEGVVIFINRSDTLVNIMRRIKSDTLQVAHPELKGMNVSANIEVNRQSSLTVVVDPKSGDSLQVQGDATLSFTIDPSGKTTLTGRFEIAEGSYNLTFYDFVKRKFILEQGGYINWNGDILEADVDLTAMYEVRTSPIDLVSDQLTGLSDQEKSAYQQILTFRLYMNMRGELLKPVITFSLDLPPNDRGALGGSVYAKLSELNENESELNKQVFALLILNRFVAQDPLESSMANDAANIARNSVSQLLSQQLNRIAANNIKGVQLNFNLQSYEDYSSGEASGRTELQVGVSKQLLNNRLIVEVGTNIDLEGEKANENSVSNITGDFSAEYKLTRDGTYRVRIYQQNSYDILEGEIVETGAGVVFTKDYNRLRDLLKKSKGKVPPIEKTADPNETKTSVPK